MFPILSVYTRHAADCVKANDKNWRRCRCPMWIWGTHNSHFVRKSAKTRSWEKAENHLRKLEDPTSPAPANVPAIIAAGLYDLWFRRTPPGSGLTRLSGHFRSKLSILVSLQFAF